MSEPDAKTARLDTDRWFAMGDEESAELAVSPTREQATVATRSDQRARRGGFIAALAAVLLISAVALAAHFGGATKPQSPPTANAPMQRR